MFLVFSLVDAVQAELFSGLETVSLSLGQGISLLCLPSVPSVPSVPAPQAN